IANWLDRAQVLRVASEHRPGIVADCFDCSGCRVEGDERRFTDDDPAAAREDARVGRSEVDGEIGRKGKRHSSVIGTQGMFRHHRPRPSSKAFENPAVRPGRKKWKAGLSYEN